MLPFEDRYSRQRKLPEVGSTRQEHLARAHLTVAPRVTGSEISELMYLSRAGVKDVQVSTTQALPCSPHAALFQFAAPRALGVGALGALEQLRRELGLQSP